MVLPGYAIFPPKIIPGNLGMLPKHIGPYPRFLENSAQEGELPLLLLVMQDLLPNFHPFIIHMCTLFCVQFCTFFSKTIFYPILHKNFALCRNF